MCVCVFIKRERGRKMYKYNRQERCYTLTPAFLQADMTALVPS